MAEMFRRASAVAVIAAGMLLGTTVVQAQEAGGSRDGPTSDAGGWVYPVGVGLTAATQDVTGQPGTRGFGLLIRERDTGWESELELSRHHWKGAADRIATRIGASWYREQVSDTWEPYLVLGFGVNLVDVAVQGYAEGGLGLGLRLNPNFTLSADVRLSLRRVLDREGPSPESSLSGTAMQDATTVPDFERGLEFRVAAIIYL